MMFMRHKRKVNERQHFTTTWEGLKSYSPTRVLWTGERESKTKVFSLKSLLTQGLCLISHGIDRGGAQ